MSELGLPNVDGGFHHHLKHDVNKPLEDHNQLPTGPVDKYHMNNAMSLDETCAEVMQQGMGERTFLREISFMTYAHFVI